MTLTPQEITHFLLALSALLVFAHSAAAVCRKFRQPPVIGEILGGFLLGPTVVGYIFPTLHRTIFPDPAQMPSTYHILGALHQVGLILLMFCSGLEIRSSFGRREWKTASLITLTGTLLPFAAGLVGLLYFYDPSALMGPAGNRAAFLLVFAVAVAVTSIPVISRIFMDLGIIETAFARIVLAAAVLEDVLLYVVLAIAVSMVGADGMAWGLPRLLGLHGATVGGLAYHVGITLAFFATAMLTGPRLFRWADGFRYNVLKKSSRVGFLVVFLIAMTCVGLYLGIAPMFGAFVAGLVAATTVGESDSRRKVIKTSSFALFVPVYFAIVGFKLDFTHGFRLGFFLTFLAFACAVKTLSVYWGARLAHESPAGAFNIAVAMNARGGPGIVLASVAYDSGIINTGFYSTLVLLSVVTSLAAGAWLQRLGRLGQPLR